MQRILNYYPNYPIHCLYFWKSKHLIPSKPRKNTPNCDRVSPSPFQRLRAIVTVERGMACRVRTSEIRARQPKSFAQLFSDLDAVAGGGCVCLGSLYNFSGEHFNSC